VDISQFSCYNDNYNLVRRWIEMKIMRSIPTDIDEMIFSDEHTVPSER